MFEYECPNFEKCEGTVEVTADQEVEVGYDRFAGVSTYFVADIVNQTCKCQLTDEQVKGFEQRAIEDLQEPDYDYYD